MKTVAFLVKISLHKKSIYIFAFSYTLLMFNFLTPIDRYFFSLRCVFFYIVGILYLYLPSSLNNKLSFLSLNVKLSPKEMNYLNKFLSLVFEEVCRLFEHIFFINKRPKKANEILCQNITAFLSQSYNLPPARLVRCRLRY